MCVIVCSLYSLFCFDFLSSNETHCQVPALVQYQQDETLYNWMVNLVRQEELEDKVVMLSRRCMFRFLESLDTESMDMWRRSVLLAATCLLVTSKIVSKKPLAAKILAKYAGGSFSMEELMVSNNYFVS